MNTYSLLNIYADNLPLVSMWRCRELTKELSHIGNYEVVKSLPIAASCQWNTEMLKRIS